MLVDGRSVEADRSFEADLCVIGGGPAGLALAREMNAEGRHVVVVEAGGPNDEGRGQLLQSSVDLVGMPYQLDTARRCAVEGSARMWRLQAPHGGHTLRLREYDKDDFAARPWLGVGPWPVDEAELRGYYQHAREMFGLPWLPEGMWGCWDEALAQSPLSASGDALETKSFDLGVRDHFLESVCRPVTRSDDVTVLHSSPVVELRCDESPAEVSSALCLPAPHKSFSVRARTFVLAGGAVENARLLLASRSQRSTGLGNGHGLVGRFFMEHPRCAAAIVIPRPGSPLRDPMVHAVHEHRGRPIQRMYALRPQAARHAQVANHLFFFQKARWSPTLLALLQGQDLRDQGRGVRLLSQAVRTRSLPDRPATVAREVMRSARYPLRWASLRRRLRTGRRVPDGVGETPVLTLEIMMEQLPSRSSRVQLADQREWLPRAQLDWRVSSDEWSGAARATRILARHLESECAARVLELFPADGAAPPRVHKANHHMGTTRMDPDPRRGVVNSDCRVHDTVNLYVAGSSVFPTGGGVNPMLTVLAITLRLADHLRQRDRVSPVIVNDT